MAETEERSLDNFFAKRDKKKKKERSSRAASSAGAAGSAGGSSGAAGAAGGAAGAGPRSGDGGTGSAGAASAGAAGPGAATKAVTKEEDEWKEFEQKEVDYSGLRVQAMQISEKEEDDNEKREDPGDNWEEGGGGGGGIEKSSGPWNKTAPVQAPPAPVIVTETPEPAMTSGVYRPPGARLTTTRKTPQGPPEIYSDTQFPSLQSTAKHVESRKDKEMEKSFEVVRHKNRGRDEVSKNQALKLQLDNQYAVLENQKSSHTQYN
ncbi:protein CDV3 homolog isoform X1 [Nycticebus coucang]|uniref:protein CDV3 homolog isoform X1 n=1 Tax=Nycticebus coucang TaxID=9470 RepID=UPI00234C1EAE|nr:protein CDV3 homolog isoform X1 [Nycticebus coucang]